MQAQPYDLEVEDSGETGGSLTQLMHPKTRSGLQMKWNSGEVAQYWFACDQVGDKVWPDGPEVARGPT